ncbi:MAG: hypothetical protein ACOYLX_00855 [Burkholderiaceae bacterium]
MSDPITDSTDGAPSSTDPELELDPPPPAPLPDVIEFSIGYGSGPALLGRDSITGELTICTDGQPREWHVGGELRHVGIEWLAPEHVRGHQGEARRIVEPT